VTTQPEPEPREQEASTERRTEEAEMRYPGHGDPDAAREDVGLDEEREPEPDGAPLPPDADRSHPAPLGHDDGAAGEGPAATHAPPRGDEPATP